MEANRDFRFLRQARHRSSLPLELIANPVCIYQCHFKYNHNTVASCGSQNSRANGAASPYNPYYLNWCFLRKLKGEDEFLKSPWLRPEDITLWEECGISHFKIAGRGQSTGEIIRLCRAYLSRGFSGNLLDLLGWPHWLAFRTSPDGDRLEELDIVLDNSRLDGFLEFFARAEPDCRLGCHRCGHCRKWSRQALDWGTPGLREAYIANMEANIRQLVREIPSPEATSRLGEKWRRQADKQVVAP